MTPDDLVGLSEIAVMCNVTPSAITNWRQRYRNFPEPWGEWKMGKLWRREDIEAWYADHLAKRRAANENHRAVLRAQLAHADRKAERLLDPR